jgi:vancomycin resistance protein YoaR
VTQKPQRENQGGRVVVLTILGLAIIFGGAYVAAYAFAGDKLPRGAEVAGIGIGGREPDAAVDVLEKAFAERATVAMTVDGQPAQQEAQELGLSVDYDTSVDAAGGGRSWAPGRLWDYYTGGDDLEPVIVRDDAAMEAALVRLDKEFGTPAREGDVTFEGGEVHKVLGRSGKEVDRTTASEELETAYSSGEEAELTLAEAEPEIDEADVQNAMNEFGNAAVSAPVTLVIDRTRVRLSPAEYAPALGMKPEGGVLVPDLDEARLNRIVQRGLLGADGAPVDATVKLVDGSPQVVPSKPGVAYEPADVANAFLDLVVRDAGKRRMAVKATVKNAEFTTKDARRLRIKERVSSFTTHYPYAEYRNTNIGRAAELVNGTVLKPGETFSLNDTVGERTAENGFTKGFIISNGIFKEDLGGGVSQLATTTFNAMFFAGLEDIEHKPHSFYIDRYPVGREATVAWGSVDLKFKNTTPYGVLVEARVTPSTPSSQGVVTVSMWSTDYWDISTKTGERYNLTSPDTRTLSGPKCVENTGYGGFDIDIWRYFRRAGSEKLVRTEKMHTHYTPSDTVICKSG